MGRGRSSSKLRLSNSRLRRSSSDSSEDESEVWELSVEGSESDMSGVVQWVMWYSDSPAVAYVCVAKIDLLQSIIFLSYYTRKISDARKHVLLHSVDLQVRVRTI